MRWTRHVIVLSALLAGLLHARDHDVRVATYVGASHPVIDLETTTSLGRVQLLPRQVARPGFEARYGNFGASFSVPLQGFDRGASRLVAPRRSGDFRTFYHGSTWGADLMHHDTRGFYAEPETPGTPGAYFPDMTLRATALTFYRAMDPDSRVSSLSNGLQQQGGRADLFWMLGATRNRLRSDTPLLRKWGTGESVFHQTRSLDAYSVFAGAGFALSTNAAGFYFDPALFAGYGAQVRAWDGEHETAWNLVKVNLRMRGGFRTPWFDAGVGFENDAHTVPAGRESVVFHTLIARAQLEVFL